MKSLSYFFLIPFLLLALSSCQKELDVPLPEHKKRLVVNAFLTAGKSLDVYLTRSYGPLEDVDKLDLFVKDATVEVYEAGSLLGKLNAQDTIVYESDWVSGDSTAKTLWKYSSDAISIQGGKSYELRASHPDYESITATTRVPANPEVLSVALQQNVARSTFEDGSFVHQSLLDIRFTDEAGVSDQYRTRVSIEFEIPFEPGEYVWQELWASEGGAVSGKDNTGAYLSDGLWLSDAGNDGQTIDGQFLIILPNAYDQQPQPTPLNIRTVKVELVRANADSYEYLRKLKQQEDNASNGFEFFPPEAIVVYSNVTQGYGIFGGLGISEIEFAP